MGQDMLNDAPIDILVKEVIRYGLMLFLPREFPHIGHLFREKLIGEYTASGASIVSVGDLYVKSDGC